MDPRVTKVSCASLTDAMGRRHAHRTHVLDLVSPTPDRELFGPAVTIRYVPFRADKFDAVRHNFARLFYEAIGGEKPEGDGRVLVLSSSGHPDVTLAGGTKLSRLQNHGLAGVVADGRLRDFEELAGYGFSTWCAGEAVRWGGDLLMPYEANVPVTLGDVTVVPGDYLIADKSGAVVIPSGDLDWVLDEAVSIEEKDRGYIDTIAREDPRDILSKGGSEI